MNTQTRHTISLSWMGMVAGLLAIVAAMSFADVAVARDIVINGNFDAGDLFWSSPGEQPSSPGSPITIEVEKDDVLIFRQVGVAPHGVTFISDNSQAEVKRCNGGNDSAPLHEEALDETPIFRPAEGIAGDQCLPGGGGSNLDLAHEVIQAGETSRQMVKLKVENGFPGREINFRCHVHNKGPNTGDPLQMGIQLTFAGVVNEAPTVNVAAVSPITLPNNTANLNGTVNDDGQPTPPALTTTWTQVSGPAGVTFADASAAITTATFPGVGIYRLRLTASDGPETTFDEVTITVNPEVVGVNTPPTVNVAAVPPITLPNNTANLNGTVNDDGQPTPPALTTTWTQVSGPAGVTFAGASAAITTATFPGVGIYRLRLTASDGPETTFDEVTITVNPEVVGVNTPPTVNVAAVPPITLPNNTANLNGTVNDDGQPTPPALTITWTQVSGPAGVTFADASAAITTATFPGVGIYRLRLTASDGPETTFDEVTITVNPEVVGVNTPPTVNVAAVPPITLPNNTANLNGTVNDDGQPTPPALTITWSQVDGPAGVTFADASAAITTATFPGVGIYRLRLTASDGQETTFDEVRTTVREEVIDEECDYPPCKSPCELSPWKRISEMTPEERECWGYAG